MKQEKKLTEEEIDYNILNALNLIHPTLGEAYISKGYNPFDEGFILETDYIEKILEENRDKTPILTEDFLEKSSKEVKEFFEKALANTKLLKEDFETQLKNGEFTNVNGHNLEKQIKNTVLFLQNRQEMLKIAIEQLNNVNANSLKLFQDVTSINKKLSQLLKESYLDEFKKETAHKNFVEYCLTLERLERMKTQQRHQTKSQEKQAEEVKVQEKQVEKEQKQQKQKEKEKEQKQQEVQAQPEPEYELNPKPKTIHKEKDRSM